MATEVKKPTDFTEGALLLWNDEANAYDQQDNRDRPVELKYSVAVGKRKKGKELIITNY